MLGRKERGFIIIFIIILINIMLVLAGSANIDQKLNVDNRVVHYNYHNYNYNYDYNDNYDEYSQDEYNIDDRNQGDDNQIIIE